MRKLKEAEYKLIAEWIKYYKSIGMTDDKVRSMVTSKLPDIVIPDSVYNQILLKFNIQSYKY